MLWRGWIFRQDWLRASVVNVVEASETGLVTRTRCNHANASRRLLNNFSND
jgi:hypothetical protein